MEGFGRHQQTAYQVQVLMIVVWLHCFRTEATSQPASVCASLVLCIHRNVGI